MEDLSVDLGLLYTKIVYLSADSYPT